MADTEIESKPNAIHDSDSINKKPVSLKLDPHGYPLHPQPSDDPLGESTASRLSSGD